MLEGNKSSTNKNKNNDNNTRTAIITGSCKGIGKAIAMEFAKARYHVMINDFEEEGELKRTAYEISKAIGDSNNNNNNPRVAYFVGDVSEEQITISMSGVDPFTSSRVGVKTLTKTVALQLAEKGIRVNAIAPGLIATDINKKLLGNEEKRKEKEKQIPFHRIGTPEEVAKIALFLASDDASYITGSLIYADGGLSLSHSNYFLESEIEED